MTERVVVLGAGYAGTTAVQRLERHDRSFDLTWVSERDYHLVRHEVHRAVRDPAVREHLTIPVEELAGERTEFVAGTVAGLDTGERTVALADGRSLDYDYLLVALGTRTAFYGIPGLEDHAHTLGDLDDALGIHDGVVEAAGEASPDDPARVVVGGGGQTGIQCAGEVAELRDEADLPVEVTLLEAMPEVMPGEDESFQRAVRRELDAAGVAVRTGTPVVEAGPDAVRFEDADPLPYDVLVWTGGITGRDATADSGLAAARGRVETDATFSTSDDRVFAVGDAALVEQDGDFAPATAQAAWQAADAAAANLVRRVEGRPLEPWTFRNKGVVVSVGDAAVAHDVTGVPFSTFGSLPAAVLKKVVAARWIKDVHSYDRAIAAWQML